MDQRQELFSFISGIVFELSDVDEEGVGYQTPIEDLGLDSLDFVEIQVAFSRRYGIKLNSEFFASGEIKTIEDMITHALNLIEQKTKEKAKQQEATR